MPCRRLRIDLGIYCWGSGISLCSITAMQPTAVWSRVLIRSKVGLVEAEGRRDIGIMRAEAFC